jgi:hypothetical protein
VVHLCGKFTAFHLELLKPRKPSEAKCTAKQNYESRF